MNSRTIIRILCIVSCLSLAVPALAAGPAAAGRWNLAVEAKTKEGKTYTHPAWLAIEGKSGQRDVYVGRLLGSAGSVKPIGEVKIDGDSVEFQAWGYTFTGTATGNEIKGVRVHNENKEDKTGWSGKRAIPIVNVGGKWAIKILGEPTEHPAILEIKHDGDAVSGQLHQGGKTFPISEARLTSNMLRLSIEGETGPANYFAAIMGDRLGFGMLSRGRAKFRFDGYRLREWDKPVKLFNGSNLDNWEPIGNVENNGWKVIDGVMTNTAGGGSANIVCKEKFRNFKAHIEFRVPEHGNSGIYLRGRHEIQVAATAGQDPSWHMCGALYSRIAPNVNASRLAGEWQTFDITLIENYLTVVHNGQVIIDNEEVEGGTGGMLDVNENEPGPIYLQGDHGPIEYRKITIWPAK